MKHLRGCDFGRRACECRAIAYHEAGHAVACLALGVRVKRIDAKRTRRGDPYVDHDPPRGATARRTDCVIALAGPEAERRALGLDYADESMSPTDYATARRFLERADLFESIGVWADVQSIVARRWLQIETIAKALLSGEQVLFGVRVRALIAEVRR